VRRAFRRTTSENFAHLSISVRSESEHTLPKMEDVTQYFSGLFVLGCGAMDRVVLWRGIDFRYSGALKSSAHYR
jgi:hypothetical protein